jgi:hypothetical protein
LDHNQSTLLLSSALGIGWVRFLVWLEFEYLLYETIDDEDPDFIGTGGRVFSPAPKGDSSLVFGVTDWAGNEENDEVAVTIR